MPDKATIQEMVDAELSRIVDAGVLGAMKPLLVALRCELREWDYGEPEQTFPCWIVLDHVRTNTCIGYCEYGFGPSSPWGLLFITGQYLSMGTDSGWYATLEDAFRGSRMPGVGFIAAQDIPRTQQQVFSYDWLMHGGPTPEEFERAADERPSNGVIQVPEE